MVGQGARVHGAGDYARLDGGGYSKVAQMAVYGFGDFTNSMLAEEIQRAATDPSRRAGHFFNSLLAEAARRLGGTGDDDNSSTAPRYEMSIDGAEWADPTHAVPPWVQDALANPYRTSVTATHVNGVTYTFRRAERHQ